MKRKSLTLFTNIKFSLPISIAISKGFMAHSNVGVTFIPRAWNKNLKTNQSLIWLTPPEINSLTEAIRERKRAFIGTTLTKKETKILISSGRDREQIFTNASNVQGGAVPSYLVTEQNYDGCFFSLGFEPFSAKEDLNKFCETRKLRSNH
jgi:hypothetical protein